MSTARGLSRFFNKHVYLPSLFRIPYLSGHSENPQLLFFIIYSFVSFLVWLHQSRYDSSLGPLILPVQRGHQTPLLEEIQSLPLEQWLLSDGKIWFYLTCNYLLETLPPLAPSIRAGVSVVVVLHWPLGEYWLASCHVVILHLLHTAHATSFCSFICLFVWDGVSLCSWRQPVTHSIASDWP